MKVYWGYTQTQSSAYYRMIGFAKEMEKADLSKCWYNDYNPAKFNAEVNQLEATIANPKDRLEKENYFRFLCTKKKVKSFIFQLFSSCWGLALIDLIHHFKQPVITEIDDYAFGVDSSNPNHSYFDPNSDLMKVVKTQLQDSDAVIVSTKYLKDLYKPFNENIHIVPNGVDLKLWGKYKNNIKKTYITVGWEGGSAHLKDVELIIPAIEYIHKKYPKVRFKFLGGELPEKITSLKRVEHIQRWIPVNKYPEYKAKAGFDIELAPIRDTLFNRAKSNLRWLEASALKIPVVASDVEPYKCIEHGKDGYLCNTTEDWIESLELLIKDATLRKQVGNTAYKKIKANYSLATIAERYARILKKEQIKHTRRMKSYGN